MTHGSLFSGIGGFDLAAEWMGWENKFHCEWNPFGQKVLHHYWPNAEQFTDIKKSNFTNYANKIDILTGGFPCQPYSQAGKRLGKEDERHLWPEMLRVIREIQPRWVVGENVRGLTNWNGGMVFDEVQIDLETIGYEIIPFLLPACAVNAPHRRDRIWFIAHSNIASTKNKIQTRGDMFTSKNDNGDATDSSDKRCNDGSNNREKRHFQNDIRTTTENKPKRDEWISGSRTFGSIITDADASRLYEQYIPTEPIKSGARSRFFNEKGNFSRFPSVSPICDGDDGLSDRLDNITFSKWRNESIKAGGNAIVPQVALQIFKAIEQYENLTP